MKLKRLFISLCIAPLLVVMAVTMFALSTPAPPKIADVAGVWIGVAKEYRFVRLELDTNGTGYFCVSFPFEELEPAPYLYRVESWRLTNFTVRLKARPVDAETPSVTFGTFSYSRGTLKAEIDKEKIELWTERKWQSRAARSQEHIARYRKENQ